MELQPELESLWESLQAETNEAGKQVSIDELLGEIDGQQQEAADGQRRKQLFHERVGGLLRQKEAEFEERLRAEMQKLQSSLTAKRTDELNAVNAAHESHRRESMTQQHLAHEQQHGAALAAVHEEHAKELAKREAEAAEELEKAIAEQRETDFALFVGAAASVIGELIAGPWYRINPAHFCCG